MSSLERFTISGVRLYLLQSREQQLRPQNDLRNFCDSVAQRTRSLLESYAPGLFTPRAVLRPLDPQQPAPKKAEESTADILIRQVHFLPFSLPLCISFIVGVFFYC